MSETPMDARSVPAPAAEPARPKLPGLFRGEWTRDGGMVGRRGEYAVLQTRTGYEVLLDRKAVELAAMALGIELPRPRIRTVCAWGGGVIVDVPEGPDGVSHGMCPCCAKREREKLKTAIQAVEVGR